jgi:hypothetical protein
MCVCACARTSVCAYDYMIGLDTDTSTHTHTHTYTHEPVATYDSTPITAAAEAVFLEVVWSSTLKLPPLSGRALQQRKEGVKCIHVCVREREGEGVGMNS